MNSFAKFSFPPSLRLYHTKARKLERELIEFDGESFQGRPWLFVSRERKGNFMFIGFNPFTINYDQKNIIQNSRIWDFKTK